MMIAEVVLMLWLVIKGGRPPASPTYLRHETIAY
jgi:hypothetical protein